MATHDKNDPRPEVPDEAELFEGAKKAFAEAIADLHRKGIPTTSMVNGKLITTHPDGRIVPVSQPGQ